MKKSFKILTLVLSLALLCGALVVAVLADEPVELKGVETCFTTDFSGASLNQSEAAQATPVKDFTIDNKGSGTMKVVTDKNDNSYFSYDYEGDDRVTEASNYSYTAPYSGMAWGSVTSLETFKGWYYTDNKYYVVDVDVYFPEGVPNGATSFYLYNYIPTKTTETVEGVETDKWGNATEPNDKAMQWKFRNKSEGGVEVLTTSGKTYDLLDGAWTHLTAFVTYEIVDETFYVVTYTAINGQIVDVAKVALPKKVDAPDPYAWWPKTARFEFSTKDTAGREMDIDNFTIRKLTKDYNGNLDAIIAQGIGAGTADWESDIYKNGEKTPYTTDAAEIKGVKYDHVQRAIAAAKSGDTITLLKDCGSVVNVDKDLTIVCGDYTMAKPNVAIGYVADYNEETKSYVVAATQQSIMIMFNTCTCPDCTAAGATPDATHPGNVLVNAAYRDNDIFNFYVNAGKSLEWSLNKGNASYNLTGWVDQNGTAYKPGDIVTEEIMNAGYLILTPVIEVEYATVEYVQGGVATLAAGSKALATAFINADEGTTIKLIANSKYDGGAISLKKNHTLDLNGYMLQAVTTKDQLSAKSNLFTVETPEFTIVGEQEGSALINFWVDKDNVNDDGTENTSTAVFQNAQTLSYSGSNRTVTVKGENLYVNVAQLARFNSSSNTIKLDGGVYAKDGVGDGYGYIYGASGVKDCTVEVKNAIINATSFISFYNTAPNTVTIDNCAVICGRGSLTNTANTYADITITNSYIACNPSSKNGTAIIGEGNYIRDNSGWDSSVVYATGVIVEAANEKVTHQYPMTNPMADQVGGKYVVLDSTFDILPGSIEITYTKYAKKATVVNFYDGETLLGTAAGDPGMKVVGPKKGEPTPVANGWVLEYTAYAYTISADSTEAVINVDVKDVTEYDYSYAVGTPELYMNYRLSDNLATNLYRPATLPEGIELVDTILNGSNANRPWTGASSTKNWVIGGVEYLSTQGWPNAWDADDTTPSWELVYTYKGTTLSYTVKANVVEYAKKVADTYAGDAEKQQQMVALLQYVEAANKIKGDTINSGLSEYLAGLKETVTLFEIPEETYDLSAISTYISGANVTVNSSRGGAIAFTLTDAGKAEGITYKIIGSVNNKAAITSAISGGKLITDNAHIPSFGAHKFTVVVYNDGAEVASAEYSLAAYYTANKDTLTADQISMVEALYALSKIGNTNN